jgi:hypothetical protein
MQGAERPANIRWTRPFLAPLKPLGQSAARQIFIDIADDIHKMEDIDKVLLLTDNMPLAIDLIGHLADSEGIPSVLSRWKTQKTSIVSRGHEATSNLELSILLSISSPRMVSVPQALDLLSLLSLLPDGLSEVEILQSQLPLDNIQACKSTLLRTALAYTNGQKRLKALVPVREYVQISYPPADNLIHTLSKHYEELLGLYKRYHRTLSGPGVVAGVASNFTNIQNVLLQSLQIDRPPRAETITATYELTRYSRMAGYGHLPLMDHIQKFLPESTDHKLGVYFIVERLRSWELQLVPNAKELIDQALEHFEHFDDPDMKCEFSHFHLIT